MTDIPDEDMRVAVAEALAAERQRIVAEVSAPAFTRSLCAVLRGSITAGDSIESIAECVVEEICSLAVAGSVPVAIPQPVGMNAPNGEPLMAVKACAHGFIEPHHGCPDPVAAATEPLTDDQLDRWAASVTLPGQFAAQLVAEIRELRAAAASSVPAVQLETPESDVRGTAHGSGIFGDLEASSAPDPARRSPRLRNRPGQPRTPRMRDDG